MKKSDWAMSVLVVVLVGIASYFVLSAILPAPGGDNPEVVETAETIKSGITEPDGKVFGSGAINPTVKVTIGNQGGDQPFKLGSQ